MKNRIRLNEAQLHRIIKESVKKVIREGVDVKQEVERYVNSLDSSIEEWYSENEFCDDCGFHGFIFNSEEEARECVLNGEEHQHAIDFVNGAQSSEDWVKYLIGGGVAPNVANKIIQNEDWEAVVKIIVSKAGPEWFLSQYSGNVYKLNNGQLLYY